MRVLRLAAAVLLLAVGPSWAASNILELTKNNVESQSFEFKFTRSDHWLYSVITVTVRPRNEALSNIRRVGGRLYRCPEGLPNHFELQETGAGAKEKDGSLIYTFHVLKGTHKCFYFWRGYDMPSEDVWWVSLDSPLVRGEETPK